MVGVIILDYNNYNDLIKCIDSICENTCLTDIKLLVIENGSTNSNCEKVELYLESKFSVDFLKEADLSSINNLRRVTVLLLEKNYGYAKGNNYGINLMLCDKEITHILILNSDIYFTNNIIPSLVHYSNIIPQSGAISPLLRTLDGGIDYCCARRAYSKNLLTFSYSYLFASIFVYFREKYNILMNQRLTSHYIEVELTSGSCMLFKKEVLEKIRGFDEKTFLYFEENILYEKLQSWGYKNFMIPTLSCIHLGGGTTNKLNNRYFLLKCNYDSLIYYMKYYKKSSFLRLLYIRITGNIRLFRVKIMAKFRGLYNKIASV